MDTNYTKQDRGNQEAYSQYLEAMDAISIEKVASASVFFEPKAGNTIVDVGMASGTSTAILAKLFPELHIAGVDINPTMVQIAKDTYQADNLSFLTDDGELLQQFKPNSVNGFFNCSTIHHITSYNGYDNNRAFNALKRQVELLKDRGVLVVRDFLKPEEKEVFIALSVSTASDKPSDADLFIHFSQTARSLAVPEQRGFPIQELPCTKAGFRRFKAFYTDVTEFIRRKDYYDNWEVELQEEYGYYTQQEFEAVFKELGLRIILSSPIHNQWIINNRYTDKLYLYDDNGTEIGFPPTNYLIAGEKLSSGKYIQLTRHLPLLENSFLQHSSFMHKDNQEILDVVHRPNPVVDIIPYYRKATGISILAKHGYPRPLVNVIGKSPVIDHKQYSGFVPEGLTVASSSDLPSLLRERFGISMDNISATDKALQYYTSPGGIDEKVHAVYVVLKDRVSSNIPLLSSKLGFKEAGYLHEYDAVQLLNTAQTGALIEARLELNLYHLFFKEMITLPAWLGEKIQVKQTDSLDYASFEDLLSVVTLDFEASTVSANFLTTQRALFTEIGASNSQSILEYVYPSTRSANTVLTLPVFLQHDELYVGLELRSLPVPQIHTGNSTILTAPARRLSCDITNAYDLEQYIKNQKIGNASVERYAKLGEKYFPSIGITTEQVYPFVVCLDKPSEDLVWVSLKDLHHNLGKIEDAHLLIAICRLVHMLDYLK